MRNSGATAEWKRVAFPSDRLTIGQLRRVANNEPGQMLGLMEQLVSLETTVARYMTTARSEATGSTRRRVHEVFGGEYAKELVALYIRLGLAGGRHEAKQLVRDWMAFISGSEMPPPVL